MARKKKETVETEIVFTQEEKENVMEETKAPEVSAPATAATSAEIVPAAPSAPVVSGRMEPSQALLDKMADAHEALETFENLKFPVITLKDGKFDFGDGSEPVEAFEGTIIYTRRANVYYKKTYKPGQQIEMPDCYSPDGNFPVDPSPNGNKPVHKDCKSCPMNQFGSSATGDGKACKNTRPVFVLVGGEAIMPRIVRVPPTSLGIMTQYVLGCVADTGTYLNQRTIFSAFQKKAEQTHWNYQLRRGMKLTEQEKADVKAIRDLWMRHMKESQQEVFMDESTDTTHHTEREAPPSMATQHAPVPDTSEPVRVAANSPF